MIQAISLIIENSIADFISVISSKYNIPFDELKQLWIQHSDDTTPDSSAAVSKSSDMLPVKSAPVEKKKSAYQKFFAIKTHDIKKTNPNCPFGELSKEISKMWNTLTKEEQSVYNQISDTVSSKKKPVRKISDEKKTKKQVHAAEKTTNKSVQKNNSIILDDLEEEISNLSHFKRSEIEDDQSVIEPDDDNEIDYDDILEDVDDD